MPRGCRTFLRDGGQWAPGPAGVTANHFTVPRLRAQARSLCRISFENGISVRVLFVHPGPLMYSRIFLRLEPLGLELVAEATRQAGHDVRLIDLRVWARGDFLRVLDRFQPEAIGFSLSYLGNVPEVVELAADARRRLPECFTFVGGHSISFMAREVLEHSAGAAIREHGVFVVDDVADAACSRR